MCWLWRHRVVWKQPDPGWVSASAASVSSHSQVERTLLIAWGYEWVSALHVWDSLMTSLPFTQCMLGLSTASCDPECKLVGGGYKWQTKKDMLWITQFTLICVCVFCRFGCFYVHLQFVIDNRGKGLQNQYLRSWILCDLLPVWGSFVVHSTD